MAKTKTSNIRIATLPTIPSIDVSTFSDEVLAKDSFTGAVYSNTGRLGNGTHYVNIDASSMKSANFVAGSAGWRIQYDGSVEFSSGIFRGDISAATGTFTGGIEIGTSPNWFRCDTSGNIWSGAATLATAPFSVTNAGALVATTATVTGALTAGAGSVINGVYLSAASVTSAKTKIAVRGWSNDIVFSATDGSTVAWAAGTVALSDGETTYDITASNTGVMTGLTYVYLDVDASTTAFQVSDISGSAVGDNRILVAVAQNIGDESKYATFQAFGGRGGVGGTFVTADSIASNIITANELAANSVTATEINVATLSAISAAMGTIVSCDITGGTFKTGTSGRRTWLLAGSVDLTDAANKLGMALYVDSSERYLKFYDLAATEVGGIELPTAGIYDDTFVLNAASHDLVLRSNLNDVLLYCTNVLVGALTTTTVKLYSGAELVLDIRATDTTLDAVNTLYLNAGTTGHFVEINNAGNTRVSIGNASVSVNTHLLATQGSTHNIGADGTRWLNIYADNFPASPIEVAESGVETFKKIGKTNRKREGKYWLDTKVLPDEFKMKDEKGKEHTELKRSVGLLIQTTKELIDKVEVLENK